MHRVSAIQKTEYRAKQEGDKRYIEGYFVLFNNRTELWPGVYEEIDPHAFDETISGDIRCLTDHLSHLVIGRTSANTFELKIDSRGVWGRAEVNPNDLDAMNTYARVERGDVDQCSFGFDILNEEISNNPDGSVTFRLIKVKMYEGSVCTFAAYPETSVQARSKDLEQHRNREWEVKKSELKRRIGNA